MVDGEIRTDVDFCDWLHTLSPRELRWFVRTCEERAKLSRGPCLASVHAATGRAVLRGEDPLTVQRWAAQGVQDYYEEPWGPKDVTTYISRVPNGNV